MADFNISYTVRIKNKFSAQAAKIKAKTKGMTAAFKSLQSRVSKLSEKFGKLGRNLSLKVTAPIVAAGTAAAVMFGKFEAGLGNTLTLLDSTAPKGFADRLEKVAKAGLKMGFAVEDTTKALFDSVSALGAGNAAISAFKVGQTLAIGGAASLSISIDGLTSLMNAYGKETTKATDVANAFFSAQKGGKTTVEALARNVGKVAPSAKAAGIGFKTLLATMAQLTLGGLSTEAATTGLRGAINSLVKPSKEAEELLIANGIAFNATTLQSQGLVQTLGKLAALAKKNPNLIAKMIPEVEARTAIAALGEKEIGNLRGIIANINKDIKEGTGLTEAFAKKNKELNITMAKMAGNIKVAAISLGAVMAPVIKRVGEFIAVATEKFVKFSETHPKITKMAIVIAALAAVVGPLLIAVGIGAAMFAALSVPILIATAAIAGIGTAIAAVIVFWKELSTIGSETIDFWSKLFGFGGNDININANSAKGGGVASQTLTNNARIDGQININAPAGVVGSVESRQSGANIGNIGLNMANL